MIKRSYIDQALARINLFGFKTQPRADYEILALEDQPLGERSHEQEEEQVHKTHSSKAVTQHWANGLRGLAAFCVMIHHAIVAFNPEATLDTKDADGTVHFWQWPIIRPLISPNFLVTLFFVLSGYVLSYRPLHRINAKASDSISVRNSLASACLRRIFRLSPPPVFSVIVSHIILLSGGFDQNLAKQLGSWWASSYVPRYITPNWHAQTVECLKSTVDLWFQGQTNSQYNVVLWTMQEELLGSLLVYFVLLATSNLQRRFRVMLVIALGLVKVYRRDIGRTPFLLGILLAEIQVLFESTPSKINRNKLYGYLRLLAFLTTLMLGLSGGSIPYGDVKKSSWSLSMYQVMSGYTKDENVVKQIYNTIGGFLTVVSISQWPAAKRLFSTRLLQFLGRISFSLYVIHVPFLLSVGLSLVWRFRSWGISNTLSIFLMVPFWLGCVISFSWFMAKFVDEKAIKFSHALEGYFAVKTTSDEILGNEEQAPLVQQYSRLGRCCQITL